LKTILLSRPAEDHVVRFRYSNRAGTSIGGLCGEFMLKPVGLNAEATLLKRNWETQIGDLFTLQPNQEAKASGDLV